MNVHLNSVTLRFFFFDVGHLKNLLNLLQYSFLGFCLLFCFFGQGAYVILGPPPGIKPTSTPLEGKVSTTAPPGGSLILSLCYN